MDKPSISYSPRNGTTPEAEISALFNVYRFVLDAKKRGRLPDRNGPDAAKEIKNDSRHCHRNT